MRRMGSMICLHDWPRRAGVRQEMHGLNPAIERCTAAFRSAMDDDINTPDGILRRCKGCVVI